MARRGPRKEVDHGFKDPESLDEALRQSEEKYRNLADSIADVFFAFDKNLKYTYWNKASEKLTRLRRRPHTPVWG
jgi:PAS domain-containing protein